MNRIVVCGLLMAASSACSGTSSDPGPSATGQPVTYFEDMVPIFEQHCLQCHQAGGIAPFSLNDYQQAKSQASSIKSATGARLMPPWAITSDGTCGAFSGSLALTAQQITTIAAWVDGGAQEGAVTDITVPTLPSLDQATELSTPNFAPVIQGGELAAFDEYRCFMLDAPSAGFITGYQVVPGTPEIVHHVLSFVVDPAAPSKTLGESNLQRMQELHAATPDREGWPCFGMAGDGVDVQSVPVAWAPGQGVVDYPNQSGVPLKPSDKIVIQVHYNLADSANLGKTDQTRVQLRIVPDVTNVGAFVLKDRLLDTLGDATPATLQAGQPSVKYSWSASAAELGVSDIPGLQLYGIMPHMHQRGHKYRMTVGASATSQACDADVQNWDFHWQRTYFYAEPTPFTANSQIDVTCDFDTSTATEPVLPGWGTRNEMCLAVLYFTFPR
jgi:hypothetical protein